MNAWRARYLPLPLLSPGRAPVVTSRYGAGTPSANPSRPGHLGDDWFYRVTAGDPAWPRGDGAATSNGRWVVPPGTPAVAVDEGHVIVAAKIRTGLVVWVEHPSSGVCSACKELYYGPKCPHLEGPEEVKVLDTLRSGYFHLRQFFVQKGQFVAAGTQLGLVGDNPVDHDASHLHFEISTVRGYRPRDPEPYLSLAVAMPLSECHGPVLGVLPEPIIQEAP